jgi:hypothetical protein
MGVSGDTDLEGHIVCRGQPIPCPQNALTVDIDWIAVSAHTSEVDPFVQRIHDKVIAARAVFQTPFVVARSCSQRETFAVTMATDLVEAAAVEGAGVGPEGDGAGSAAGDAELRRPLAGVEIVVLTVEVQGQAVVAGDPLRIADQRGVIPMARCVQGDGALPFLERPPADQMGVDDEAGFSAQGGAGCRAQQQTECKIDAFPAHGSCSLRNHTETDPESCVPASHPHACHVNDTDAPLASCGLGASTVAGNRSSAVHPPPG